jgi:phosphatidylglycerophosphatase A
VKTRLAFLLGTWFGCGYAPVAPGTAGSIAALLIAIALHTYLGWGRWEFLVASLVLCAPGVWAAAEVGRSMGREDPGIVVVDEVAGLWITLAGATAFNWKSWLAALVLFRVFDIWKPPPVRRMERLPGGVGVMADDMVAGVYGALLLYAAGYWNLY